MYEICAINLIGRNIYVLSKFSCERSSHNLCARAHAHSLEGTLPVTLLFNTHPTTSLPVHGNATVDCLLKLNNWTCCTYICGPTSVTKPCIINSSGSQ